MNHSLPTSPPLWTALIATTLCVACDERPPSPPVPSATAQGTASGPTKQDKIKGLHHDIDLLEKKIARLKKKAARSFAKDEALKVNKVLAATKEILARKKRQLAELEGRPLPSAKPAPSSSANAAASSSAAASASASARQTAPSGNAATD